MTLTAAIAKIYSDATKSQRDHMIDVLETMNKQFCPTGPGGGVDPTCGSGKGGGGSGAAFQGEPKTPAPPPPLKVNVDAKGQHGITKAARVGVGGEETPPPPKIGRLPNLTPREREVESAFADAYEKNPDKVASDFLSLVKSQTKPGDPPTFGTDDAKCLSSAWMHPDQATRAQNRATLNTPLHQTANAIAKKAFLQHLDTLKPGDEVLVTVGGCGAGKGYALKNVEDALAMKKRAAAVWDSAGDQNATENPWIQKEVEKRGLKASYVFVHVDPVTQWGHPDKGVIKRAGDPNDGRMVDAKVFADSYAIGAKNHAAFHQAHKNNPNANFVFIDNSGKPTKIDGIPPEALKLDRKALAKTAEKIAETHEAAPPHVKRGALMGSRIWED